RERALLVGLDRESRGRHAVENVESELEALRFLGVDGHAHAALRRELRQSLNSWNQFMKNPGALCLLEARVQRGELHRDAVGGARGLDGVGVQPEIARGIV